MTDEMEKLAPLAERFHALEKIDKRPFQRRARILQALWRERRGYPIGSHRGKTRGNYLEMPWAEETLANYLDDEIRQVVRGEVQDPARSKGKMYGKPRIYNNLLSSQPLAFNLFAHLALDHDLATAVMREVTGGRVDRVVGVLFEHSPGRADERYTGDRSAFDVYLRYATPQGGEGFVGVEVKYHEDLAAQGSSHRDRYDEIALQMGCFAPNRLRDLRLDPLQQIWRDHLLAGIHRLVDPFDDGFFAILAPADNDACQEAIDAYRTCLVDDETFASWTIEDVVAAAKHATDDPWVGLLEERYLDFAAVDAALDG